MPEKIFQDIGALIGATPLLELEAGGLPARVLLKLEYLNPGGSVKDRIAKAMLAAAEASGQLKPGGVIIEPTSGNTGIGLAALAASRGYRFIATMPETMSAERRKLMAAYGAEIVLTPGREGMQGAIARATELAAQIPGSIQAGQFSNPANPRAHLETTGPEIFADTAGNVDIFVAGIGTGGTISGVGEYLKSVKPEVKIMAVEPLESPVLSGGKPGPHKIQGIGAGFVPQTLNTAIYDDVIRVASAAAMETARKLARQAGLLVGISSGAAAWAALELARKPENAGKTIVALLPDGGERYLSTELFDS
ncbi:MAG: cysteine synthase A [Desulfovibrio sp.]|nr:cysteine synthase A [Desulfovibrio sp.]